VVTAIEQMQKQKLESVIVTRNGLAVRMVTSSDVVEKVVLKGEDSSRVILKSVMSFPLVTMSFGGNVKQVLQLMRVNRIKRVREILIVIGLYIFLSVLTGSVLSHLTGRSFEDGMFESVSALSTTRMSTGITSLALDPISKLMLITNMIIGRFEIIAILYSFFSSLRT